MFQKITAFLNTKQFKSELLEGQTVAIFGVETAKGKYKCVFDLKEEEKILLFYSIIQDFYIPENQRNEFAVFITQINYGLMVGNFEMDFSDGEVRYKTSIDFEGVELADSLIDNLFNANLSVMENFYEHLHSFFTQE